MDGETGCRGYTPWWWRTVKEKQHQLDVVWNPVFHRYLIVYRTHGILWAPGGRKNTHQGSLSYPCQCMTQTKQLFWSLQTKPGHWHVSSLAPAVVTYLHLSLRLSRYRSLFLRVLYTYSVCNNPDSVHWTQRSCCRNLDACKKWRALVKNGVCVCTAWFFFVSTCRLDVIVWLSD